MGESIRQRMAHTNLLHQGCVGGVWSVCSTISASAISYPATSRLQSGRLTESRTAVVTIKNFKPTLTRVPLGGGRRGISQATFLALECNFVDIIGSIGEAEWGGPGEIHENSTIRDWLEGLRQDGGGG